MPYIKWTMLGAVLAGIMLNACAARTVKLYEGAELSVDKIARIENNPMVAGTGSRGAAIDAVDGAKVSMLAHRLQVLPGAHTFSVQCSFRVNPQLLGTDFDPLSTDMRRTRIQQYKTSLTADVEAGRIYRVEAGFMRDQTCTAKLVDITR